MQENVRKNQVRNKEVDIYNHYRSFSTLTVHLYSSSGLSLSTFCHSKSCKNTRHMQNQSQLPFLTSRKRHPSVGCYFPQTAFRSSIGDKTTRFSRNNSNAAMQRSNIFCPVSAACPAVCCNFESAGFYLTLPSYAVKYAGTTSKAKKS